VHHSKKDKLKAQGLRVKLKNVHRAKAAKAAVAKRLAVYRTS
jgi:hypothetical protein